MGKYLSPTKVQAEQAELKCAIVFYPEDEGAFFRNALVGQLHALSKWYLWEGKQELTDVISQKWILANLKTDEYMTVHDCELLTEAIEDGEMAINVTVNNECGGCGCGGGSGGSVSDVDYPNPTVIPIPPPSGGQGDIDDGVSIPDGFESYEEYRAYKCGVATALVDDFTETVGNLQSLGGLVAVGAGYAMVALGSVTTYNAVVVGLAAAGLSVSGGLILLTLALTSLIFLGAVVFDHFDTIFDELVANREDFICQVYNASNETEARQVFYDVAGTAVTNLAVSDGVKDQLGNAVVGIIDALVPGEIVVTLFKFVQEISYEDFDCSSCGSPPSQESYTFTFDADAQGWTLSTLFDTARWGDLATYGNQGGLSMWTRVTADGEVSFNYNQLVAIGAPPAAEIVIDSIEFSTWKQAGSPHGIRMQIGESGAGDYLNLYTPSASVPESYAGRATITHVLNHTVNANSAPLVRFGAYDADTGQSILAVFVDDVKINYSINS